MHTLAPSWLSSLSLWPYLTFHDLTFTRYLSTSTGLARSLSMMASPGNPSCAAPLQLMHSLAAATSILMCTLTAMRSTSCTARQTTPARSMRWPCARRHHLASALSEGACRLDGWTWCTAATTICDGQPLQTGRARRISGHNRRIVLCTVS